MSPINNANYESDKELDENALAYKILILKIQAIINLLWYTSNFELI